LGKRKSFVQRSSFYILIPPPGSLLFPLCSLPCSTHSRPTREGLPNTFIPARLLRCPARLAQHDSLRPHPRRLDAGLHDRDAREPHRRAAARGRRRRRPGAAELAHQPLRRLAQLGQLRLQLRPAPAQVHDFVQRQADDDEDASGPLQADDDLDEACSYPVQAGNPDSVQARDSDPVQAGDVHQDDPDSVQA